MKSGPLAQPRQMRASRRLNGQHIVRIAMLVCAIGGAALGSVASTPPPSVHAAPPSPTQPTRLAQPTTQSLARRLQSESDWFRLKHIGKKLPPADARSKALAQAAHMKRAPTTPATRIASTTGASVATAGLGVWTALGPSPIDNNILQTHYANSGRITALAVNPTNSNEVWAGAADGGLWHSGTGGSAWAPVTDDQNILSVGAIAIDPSNPRTIYIGTGEGDYSNDDYWGMGILKSTDNGQTWTNYGQDQFSGLSFARLAIDPANTQIILAAVTSMDYSTSTGGSTFPPVTGGTGSLANMGIWRSTDGGNTWTQVIATDPNQNAAGTDIAFDPALPYVAYAAMGGLISTSTIAGMYKSIDSGQTWSPITTAQGMPDPRTIRRIAFGISADGTHLYAAIDDRSGSDDLLNNSIYSSIDSGNTWSAFPVNNSAMATYNNEHFWYYGPAVAVDPADASGNTVLVAGADIYYSTDGAITWNNMTNVSLGMYGVHTDQHAIAFFSTTSSSVYIGNDGGVWSNTGTFAGPIFNNLNAGLNITQFYGGGIGSAGGDAQLYGGTQDNGTDQYPTGTPTGLAQWNEVQGGDGGNTVVDFTNNAIVYGEILITTDPNNNEVPSIVKSTDGGATWNTSNTGITWSQPHAFVPPLVVSPNHNNNLFTGTDHFYKSYNSGASWTQTSANPVDLQGTTSGASLTAIAVFPSNDNYVYVADTAGLVSVSTDAGATWTPRPFPSATPSTGGVVTGVAVDPLDPSIIYATVANFATCSGGALQCGKHVFRATHVTDPTITDPNIIWTDISGGLPNAPFESIAVSPLDNNTVFVGSDVGIFESTDATNTSQPPTWMHLFGLPNVSVEQIFTDRGGGTLYVATHGRGMWKVPVTTGHVYAGYSVSPSNSGWDSLNSSDASVAWQDQNLSPTTSVYANGILYIQSRDSSGMYYVDAFDATSGTQRWQSPLSVGSNFAGVTVANGAVYTGVDQTAYALNASSGALIWSHQIGANLATAGPPAADTAGVYFGAKDGKEYAFSVSTGTQLWSRSINSTKGPAPSPSTAAYGLVYVASNDSTSTSKNTLYALNASTGRVSYSALIYVDTIIDAPIAANGLLYFVGFGGNWLHAWKPDFSASAWDFRQGQYGAQGGPAVDGSRVFIIESGYMYGVDAITGKMLWGPAAPGMLGNGQGHVPAAAGGVVFAPGNCTLYAFSEVTGNVLWQWAPGAPSGFCAGIGDPTASS